MSIAQINRYLALAINKMHTGAPLISSPSPPLSSVHAAVIAINEAIDQGVPEGTLAAMQNPNAMLVNLDGSSARDYHDTLYRAKGEKVANSRKRVRFCPHWWWWWGGAQ